MILMRVVIVICCGILLLSCSSGGNKLADRVELILTPRAKAVLYTETDSLHRLLHPVECRRITDCYMGYSALDTSFAIGFSLDTNAKGMSAAEWLQVDVAQRQIEAGGELKVTVVNGMADCDQCAYAYYEKDTPFGHVSYFSGMVMRNGFSVGMYSQLVQHDAQSFAAKCIPLLKGLEVEVQN